MNINKKWFSKLDFSDGHPQSYHIVAIALAITALSIAITTRIFAQTMTAPISTTVQIFDTSDVQALSCSYSYTDWSDCRSDGTRIRTVAGVSPDGCAKTTTPLVRERCTYVSAPTEEISTCSYTYGAWGSCQSEGKRYRPVTSTLPSGCSGGTSPQTAESCTYTSIGTTTTIVSPVAMSTTITAEIVQCVFTYSSWGSCQENGKRVRKLSSTSPTGCTEYTHPVLEQSCVFDSTTTTTPTAIPVTTLAPQQEAVKLTTSVQPVVTTSEQVGNTGSVTPTFSFMNVGDGMTLRGDFKIKGSVGGAQGVEYYLVPTGSNTYKYIGTGKRLSDTEWELDFHSQDFPNGEFYLRAKIKNTYGEYGGGQRKVFVSNDNKTTVSVDGFQPLGTSNQEKTQILQQFEQSIGLPVDTTVVAIENPDQQKKKIFDYCQENPQKCFPDRDSDKDGLSDVDEIRYGTDPHSADTDLDGFTDGDEVKNGFDPTKYSPGDQTDRIVFEDPKITGETKNDIYAVNTVVLAEKETGNKKLLLTGKGLPNSFVTIYVYSDPIVLTVKTDSDGNWTYELDKDLENGNHQVYVAVTDNTGKITAKSEPLAFVKTAEAATIIPSVSAAKQESIAPVSQNRSQRDIFFLVAIIIGALGVALSVIGFIKHRQNSLV